MLKEADMVKLLGRSLTATESANYDLYLKIATERLEDLLCMTICGDDSERTFATRLGYRTVYIDPFTSIDSVTIDGEVAEEDTYTIKQNDKFNGSWYNIIEFTTKRSGEDIVVDADWGFDKFCPAGILNLLAQLFNLGSVEQLTDNTVKSKKIEDFSVTYKDTPTFDSLVLANSAVIDKYSQCNQGVIRHGRVQSIRHY